MESSFKSVFYQDFFNYNHQTNLKLVASYESLSGQLSPKIIELSCHIMNAHTIWNARLKSIQDPCKPWDLFPIEKFAEKDQSNFESTMEILHQVDLDVKFKYKNSMGKSFESYGSDVLTHIVNHSTYHRGQIAMLMRELGLEPLPSDFIQFKIQD
ncbi:damage-inducible protein DinB [Algoriphagus lutimaris]|uniref:DinB family protein n=1 Tax=Algoriphagus lutimaris TaxID=613197 RepID=UPI00196AA0BB|nr:DinB family protein [Algoriphagus lutimaris]MBN3518971.1 damage-inducible protein DinB [Algoriphagus lutimaris]